jgi:3-isopropylmalate dehydratase small subunit
LPILESPPAVQEIQQGDLLSIDIENGIITNLTRSQEYRFTPIPSFMQKIIGAGGLVNYVKESLSEKR